jgi:hypothetical protein
MIPANKWFNLLKKARIYLNEIIEKVEVEIGYIDNENSLSKSPSCGAVNRIIIDVDLKMYPCPLLVENQNGQSEGNLPRMCTIDECPVFFDDSGKSESNFKQICPFVLTSLKSAVEYIYYKEDTANE